MSIAKVFSRGLSGMSAPQIIVEVHVASGLPSFSIVGLPDTEIKESRDRIRSAIQNSGFDFPARRITVNLAPADLPKDSSRYDLPIAIGIIIAAKLITPIRNISEYEFAGELALDGEIRPIKGALAMAFGIHNDNRTFILPIESAKEASLIEDLSIVATKSLQHTLEFLIGKIELVREINCTEVNNNTYSSILNLSQVKGQIAAKKALEIAAAGRHSLLMIGNPGCGKSMLAERFKTILPQLDNNKAIETASLHSISNLGFDYNQWKIPPFRSPHHSSSAVALVGGGSNPKPGEISLAHNGVLFLDELPEFERKVLEVMREPLESRKISLARANCKVEYLADFQLIAAMNPCPCGNSGHPQKICSCSVEQINRYKSKISGPLLDRIDIILEIPTLKPNELQELSNGESSEDILIRVNKAQSIQFNRQNKLNYQLNNQELEEVCKIDDKGKMILGQLIEKQGLSARSYYRLLKLSRTIADLDEANSVQVKHISQANQYKKLL